MAETYQGSIVYRSHQEGAYDNNWLKEYELFYNKQFGSTPYVRRIFFKINNSNGKSKFAGFTDIRPVSDGSEVCESYLVPPERLRDHAYIKCMRKRNYYGKTFQCTPFIMPDCTFGMCMQTAIWICLKILEGTIEKPLAVPEIQAFAHGTPYADSEGLDFARTARIFRISKANSIYRSNKQHGVLLSDKQMLNELYAYVESSLPVIIGVDTNDLSWWVDSSQQGYHVIVAIGHTMSGNNEIDGFVFHDESALPYITLPNDKILKAWHAPRQNLPYEYQKLASPVREMIVAVPPEVSLPYHRAFQQFKQWLAVFIERGLVDFDFNDNLEYRSFLSVIDSDDIEQIPIKSLSKALNDLKQLPEFLWFIFIFDKNASRDNWLNAKVIFIRDATRQTEFRLLYLQKEQTSFYQLSAAKIFKRSNNLQGRTPLTI